MAYQATLQGFDVRYVEADTEFARYALGSTAEQAALLRSFIEPDLVEWNYGKYEGLTPAQIHATAPGWLIFRDGCPGGETPAEVGARVDRVIAQARAVDGDVALFAHGHVLRVLVARWLGLPPGAGQHFLLDTGTLNVLSYYRGLPAVKTWNAPAFVGGDGAGRSTGGVA